MITTVNKIDLKDVLMEPKAAGVKEAYFMIKGENNQNIYVISPGKNGNEFNKTLGHFNLFPGVETYQVVYGNGVLLLQRNLEGEPKEVRVISLRAGMPVEVPAGYGHCFYNIGKGYLVIVQTNLADSKKSNSEMIKEKQGLAYYLIDRKGDVAFEANPRYKLHPQVTTG